MLFILVIVIAESRHGNSPLQSLDSFQTDWAQRSVSPPRRCQGVCTPPLALGMFYFQLAYKAASGAHDAGSSWTDVAVPSLLCPPLSSPSPVPSAASIISKWIRHRCHCWRDSHTTSLVLWQQQVQPLSHSQVHFGLSLNVPNYAPQHITHIKTATFQPLLPWRRREQGRKQLLQILLSNRKEKRWKQDYFVSEQKKGGEIYIYAVTDPDWEKQAWIWCHHFLENKKAATFSVNIMLLIGEWRGNYRGDEGGNTFLLAVGL